MSDAPAAAAPKVKKAAPKKPMAHPGFAAMIQEAITALKERGGSSLPAIKKFIGDKYKGKLPNHWDKMLSQQLKRMSDKGMLVKVKASYKLGEALKKPKKAPKKKVAPKKKAAAKPKAAKPKAAKPKAAAKPKVAGATKAAPKKAAVKKTATKVKKAPTKAAAKPKAAKKPAAKKPAAKKVAKKAPAKPKAKAAK